MPSSASPLLKLELQADGENADTWGAIANVQFELLEQAIAKLTAVTVGGIDITPDDSQFVSNSTRAMGFKFTGTISANINIIIPARTKRYLCWNASTGSFTLTVKTSGGTGVVVPQGYVVEVFCDGTNVYYSSIPVSVAGIVAPVGAVNLSGALNTAQGADVASAGTIDLDAATGNLPDITGTTTVTAVTLAAGRVRLCRAAAAFQLTHSSTLVLPSSANYTTVAGDYLLFVGRAAGVVTVQVFKADGTSVVSPTGSVNNFRLTLTSNTPITTSDVTAAGTLYLTPHGGNQISLYDGSVWRLYSSAQVSISLAAITTGKPYDVFAEYTGGAVTLSLTAWTNDTTRATALTTQDGVLVKTGDLPKRYVGTIYPSGAGTTEDSAAKRYVWNYYNRILRRMQVTESADSWTYTTATFRQANGNTANQLDFVIGVSEAPVSAQVQISMFNASNVEAIVGIGLDSTSVLATGFIGGRLNTTTTPLPSGICTWIGHPGIGLHYLAWLEYSDGTGSSTWYGDGGTPTRYQSGIFGSLEG